MREATMMRTLSNFGRWGGVLLLSTLLAACDSVVSLDPTTVHLVTDSVHVLEVHAGATELHIEYAIRNRGLGPVYVEPNCLGEIAIRLEWGDGESWSRTTPFTPRVFADCGPGERIAVLPGDALELELVESSDGDADPEGVYRLVVEGLYRTGGRGTGAAFERASGPFRVRW